MRLLHLSDIHFKEPDCLDPATDPERPYRTRLKADLVALCAEKAVDAILVSGDIAFKGHPAEFTVGDAWLKELAAASGCRPDRIYVVPGNHDVDRSICRGSMAISNAQAAIANAPHLKRETVLRAQLRDDEAGAALFKPLAAYNAFASPLGCFVSAAQPYWFYNLDDLGGGVTLRLHGLTSTLISGLEDRDDQPGRLYLSPLQTVLDPEPDVINLVMSHHPPRWFLDEQAIDDAVNDRAPLQFFGHEHRQRCIPTDGYMRFSAGAVNPERHEPDWKPGYNVIDIEVVGAGEERVVRVRAHVRQLQKSPERFIAVTTKQGQDVWTQDILFPSHATHVVRPADTQPAPVVAAAPAAPPAPVHVATPAEVAMSSPSTKGLVFRFWNLPDSQKREIMFKLKLISQEDLTLSDEELYDRGLRLAAKQGLLEALAHEVDALQQQG
jgi:predicted phosphodiesterase